MLRPIAATARLAVIFGASIFPMMVTAGSCVCLTCALDPDIENFRAVSESMAPTIDVGDCAVMRKIDPFETPVRRGDIIGFVPQTGQPVFVFRVIAIAGDSVALRDGQVILNGQPLPQRLRGRDEFVVTQDTRSSRCETPVRLGETCTRSRLRETLPNGVSYEILDIGPTRSDTMPEVGVPASHVFVMGDHRDNAFDSRFDAAVRGPGFISLENIRGIFDGL